MFKEGKISINIMDPNTIRHINTRTIICKIKDTDKDNKIGVHSKDEMKKILGTSPDISDAVMMKIVI